MSFAPLRAALVAAWLIPAGPVAALDTNAIARGAGLPGEWSVDGRAYRISLPRDDVPVRRDDVRLPPFLGLTSWVAFRDGQTNEAVVLGEWVLLEDEVNAVISTALDSRLEVTALRRHALQLEPPVHFLHFTGRGSAAQLAGAVRSLWTKVKSLRAGTPSPRRSLGPALPAAHAISVAPLSAAFTATPETKDGMVKFVFGRVARMEDGTEMGREMGLGNWAGFGGTDGDAIVTGEFACQENEVQPVLRSLRGSGIEIVAIQQRLARETPRQVFVQYWGRGPAMELARAVRIARGEQTKAAAVAARAAGGFREIGAVEFEKLRTEGRAPVLDVRSPEEFAKGHVTGAINLDIHSSDFAARAARWDSKQPILVNCHAGSRGAIAAAELSRLGFKAVFNLEGGLDAWEKAGHRPEK